jgi:hypothetical protein
MMKTIFALSAAWWLAVFSANGQDVPPAFEKAESKQEEEAYDPFDPMIDAPKMIRVQVEHIELPHKDLTRLLMEDKAVTADATELRMKLQELVEKDEAKIFDTQIVVGRSGQKSTIESIHEFMYPTEYESVNPPQPNSGKEKYTPPSICSNPVTPTAYETKNLGSMLEAEPTIGEDERIIDLRFLPELIWHTGDTVWYERKDELGNVTKVAMPDFYKLSINTSITCVAGQYIMAGVLSPKDEKGGVDRNRKIMIFVKCDVLAAIP